MRQRGGRTWRRRGVAVAAVMLAAAACSPTDPGLQRDVPGAGAPPVAPEPAPPSALVTPLGVPVAVIARSPDGFVVRTPCGNEATVTGGQPLDGVRVVVDPGHGGATDPGAIGPNGVREADLNLRLSVAIADEVAGRGVPVALTRAADYQTVLPVRAAFADALDADAMVSVHHNAPVVDPAPGPGTEVFVQKDSGASSRLGGLLYEEVTVALSQFPVEWVGRPDAGVLLTLNPEGLDAYGILRRPATPTALLELGYLANPSEAALFATDAYIDVAANAVANAVEAYLTTDRPGAGFGNPPRVFRPGSAPGADVCTDPPLE